MKPSTPYSAKDIERYHSGQLSVAERHAIEKAALDDPFLADALEGFAFTKTPSADINNLQLRLQERINKKEKGKRIFYIGNNWMKIAALFIVIAGGGWLIFNTFSDNNTELAITPSAQKSTPVVTAEQNTDSNAVVPATPFTTETATPKKENENTDFRIVHNSNKKSANKEIHKAEISNLPATFIQPLKDSNNQSGYFSDEVAKVRDDKNAEAKFKSNYTTKEKDEAGRVSSTDTIKNFDVVLQPTNAALDEVIVLNKKSNYAAPRQRMQMVVDTLEPVEGWTSFDNYIAGNIKAPDELRAKPLSGEVELSFDVNQQGEPVNITVIKSLCSQCDQEAIRLLKEGPKWNKNGKKGKVKIRF